MSKVIKIERHDGYYHVQSGHRAWTAKARPWDGANRPERSDKNRAHAGCRPLTDRERHAANMPTKEQAKAIKGRGKRG